MAWSSTTQVARVPQEVRNSLWNRVCALPTVETDDWGEEDSKEEMPQSGHWDPVCCYAMQGSCRFGGSCEFSHDISGLKAYGCSFGPRCHLGHGAAEVCSERAEDEVAKLRTRGFPAFVECKGPLYDDSDPLWDEVACALMTPDEDLGDADLPAGTRQRLMASGEYRILNKNQADEWLCFPACLLLERLEAAADRWEKRRRGWLTEDMGTARVLWSEVSAALRRRGLLGPQLPGGVEEKCDTTLACAAARADTALNAVISGGPAASSGVGTARDLESLEVALRSVGELLEVSEKARQKEDYDDQEWWDQKPARGSSLDDPSDDGDDWGAPTHETGGTPSERTAELRRCLSRRLLLLRGAASTCGIVDEMGDVDMSTNIQEVNISAPATSLDGNRGPGSSRSPASVLELAREAAERQEHVIIHHVVRVC